VPDSDVISRDILTKTGKLDQFTLTQIALDETGKTDIGNLAQSVSTEALLDRVNLSQIQLTEQQSEINKLQAQLNEANKQVSDNENLIKQYTQAQVTLQDKANLLQKQLTDKQAETERLQIQLNVAQTQATAKDELIMQLTQSQATLQEKVNLTLKQLVERQDEVENLKVQLNDAFTSKAGESDELLKQFTQSQLVNSALRKEVELKAGQVVELEGSLESYMREVTRTKSDLANMAKLFQEMQEAKNRAEAQLESIIKGTQASFDMSELSKYLTGVINDFNDTVNAAESSVNYVLKGLDVEMKAHVSKADDNRLLMSAPSLASGSEESLSVIKFSIGASPKL